MKAKKKQQVELTLQQSLELALDPVEFSRRAGLDPDPWQAQLLRSSSSRVLLNCSRQTGKSTTAATLAVHTALFEPGSLVLLLSPSLRQSQELFKKALACYHATGDLVPVETESALRLELVNKSRIVSLPGKEGTIRGFSGVELLIIDEAARVASDLYFSVRPMLAVSGGRLFALSTPYGSRGWWHGAWHSEEAWERYEVPAESCSRISPDFLAEERRVHGDWLYDQEYGCQFVESEDQAFGQAEVSRAQREDIEYWF